MSIEASRYVWENGAHTAYEQLVLLALADHVDSDGICWPTIQRLSKRCKISPKSVRRCIKSLENSGRILVHRQIGVHNSYQLILPTQVTVTLVTNVHQGHSDPTTRVTVTPPPGHSDPPLPPHSPPSSRTTKNHHRTTIGEPQGFFRSFPRSPKAKTCAKKISVKKYSVKEKFSIPSLDEVAAYCAGRGNSVDAQLFVDHYTSNGWCVGSTPMKNWRATIRVWERRNGSSSNGSKQKTNADYLKEIFEDARNDEI